MSAHMYPVSVTFHDVAACFSAEEWSVLEDWQKELYRKVMRDIHSSLETMGFQILNPDVLFRIKKVKDLYIEVCETERGVASAASSPVDQGRIMGLKQERVSHPDACRRRGSKPAAHPDCSPDILLRIKHDDLSSFRDLPRQSPTHNAAEPVASSAFSLPREEEKTSHPAGRSEVRTGHLHRRVTSQQIKQEKLDYIKVSVGGHGSDAPTVTPRGRVSSQPVRHEESDYLKAPASGHVSDSTGPAARGQVTSKPIKQEELEYVKVSVGGHGPEDTTATSRDAGEPAIDSSDAAPPTQSPTTQASSCHGPQAAASPNLGVPRLRIVKFTEKELDVLVDLVIENYSKLFGKEADITPSVAKNAMWQAIASEVSAVGVASRTSDKVKKRWKDAKRKMNEKLSEAANHVAETGRRPPPHLRLAPYEQRLRDFFRPEFSKEVEWNQDKEDLPEELEAEPIQCAQQEPLAIVVPSPQCQDTGEDSSKDSSEDPSILSPENRQPDAVEERDLALESESEAPDHHLSAINSSLHNLSSHQRESNILMQEQNAILSQIAYSLTRLQIQQTDGLAALGSIIQRGIEVIHPAACPGANHRTPEHPSIPSGPRRQVVGISRYSPDQPVPPKRKIT